MELLQKANAFLVENLGEFGPLYAIGGLGLLLIIFTLPALIRKRIDPLDKLKKSQIESSTSEISGKRLRSQSKLDKYAEFLEPKSAEELGETRMRMMRAGYRTKNAVQMYHFTQLILGLGLMAVGLAVVIFKSSTGGLSVPGMAMWIILPGLAGYYFPVYWVERRIQTRQEEIVNGFPDSLDMMLVCVEAGQSLDQSILRVAKEVRAGYPALAEEYDIVSQEVKAGKDRVTVLKDMGERCGVPDVASFVTVLVQSATFGTSISEALRVYADEMRDKRVMRAEEKANVLPTKLTLGTMMFTVPPLLIILIGPSIYDIYITLTRAKF
ncbi:type II secretion system F family protein [Actibacterium pelagium]|uniref:Pilus assembly protein TadC n=1 Tax=Actibacterium pelagium TaxID=2029103 RepID=A0A917AL72_9RHOB|nr:type II secretion system F family protein [Actibacterium pelagium]GGE60172.1 pilus assembly protein TadC [Actibacterium pelagium]